MPKPPRLDARLSMAALHVREGSALADIGSDHGMLPVYLVLGGKISRAICADINEKPLAKSRELVELYNLSGKIQCVLSDGLSAISPGDADDIVIAGMGGDLIASIIGRAAWLKDPGKKLILQPMSMPERLRRYLFGAGFEITAEDGVNAQNRLYTVMSARYSGGVIHAGAADEYVGRLPLSPLPESAAYIRKTAQRLRVIGDGLRKSNTKSNNYVEYYNLANELLSLIVEK